MIPFVAGGPEPLWIPVGRVRCGVERAVGKDHRVVDEEGLLLVCVDEVANEVGADLGAILAIRVLLFFPVEFEQRVDEAPIESGSTFLGTTPAGMLPKTGFFEAKVLWRILLLAQLPFAGDCGGVTRCLELVGKGGLSSVQHAELNVIADIVLPGHDLCPRRRADRVGETVGKTDASLGQFIEVGRLAGFAAVGGQGFVTHVVGHDEDDVGPGKGAERTADHEKE